MVEVLDPIDISSSYSDPSPMCLLGVNIDVTKIRKFFKTFFTLFYNSKLNYIYHDLYDPSVLYKMYKDTLYKVLFY